MATLTVGQGQQYATIGAAVGASRDGDILQVQAGTYVDDFAHITTKITLQGVGGMVRMVANGPIDNDKGILIIDTDVTIDHFEFSGAQGASGNDAGIRYQGGNLTVTNSYFHDNQNGLLANPVADGTITIRNSEFANNGTGDGYTHNLYVGNIARLTISDSYFHDASVGHEIKSRAAETIITNTRIFDNGSTSSYSIDLPNGGRAVLTGNTIEQGANGQNPNVVAFGAEGNLYAGSSLTMSNNTVINDMGRGALLLNASGSPATLEGSKVWGFDGALVSGSGVTVTGTTVLAARPTLDMSHPYGATSSTTPDPVPNPTPDPVVGTPGNDILHATAANPDIDGGAGNDTITGTTTPDKLWGGDGADSIAGGSAFDNINGNKGDDYLTGGAGDDWVVGGQGHDIQFGDAGNDIVLGNLGNDTLNGGAGADQVRGGQGDDLVMGGQGNDYISGDRGADTLTGGLGADRFHTFGGADSDLVTDFNRAEGDRVLVDPGSTYSVAQDGANTVISMTGGATMTLANVQLSSLSTGWIYEGWA